MTRREILNPIVHASPLTWFPTGESSVSGTSHTTTVYLADPESADPNGWQLGRPPTVRQRLQRSYWRYEVDTAHHWTAVGLGLPAEEEAFSFRTWISLTWNVHDPVTVARTGIRDAKPIIRGFLDHNLRAISRRHSIEEAGQAEEEMAAFLERKLGDIPYGFRLSLISVNVGLDEAAEKYLIARAESRRAKSLAGDDHELETLRRAHVAEQARREGDREREQVRHTAEIERMRADHDRTLAALTAEHDLALKRQRVDFYRSALQGGGFDVLVLHLIEHPQDVQAVIRMLQEGHKEDFDRARSIIDKLLERNLMNAADAEPMRAHVIDQIRSAFGPISPTMTFTRESSTRTIEEKTEKASLEVPLTSATS